MEPTSQSAPALPVESPLEELGLSVRARNALKSVGCNTIADVLKLDLERPVRGLGRLAREELLAKLESAGIPHPSAARPSQDIAPSRAQPGAPGTAHPQRLRRALEGSPRRPPQTSPFARAHPLALRRAKTGSCNGYSPRSLALACATSYGQSLTGKWVGQSSPYDNGLEIVVALNQGAGGSVTGYVQGSRSNDTISSGKVEGDKFTLEAERPGRGGGAPQKVTYTGVLENGKIKLTMPAFGGRGPGGPGRGPGPDPAALPEGRTASRGGRGGQPQVIELRANRPPCPSLSRLRAPLVKLALPAPVKANGLAKTPPMGGTAGTSSATR